MTKKCRSNIRKKLSIGQNDDDKRFVIYISCDCYVILLLSPVENRTPWGVGHVYIAFQMSSHNCRLYDGGGVCNLC